MVPLEFPDKRAALSGAFINRFSIGFVIGAVRLDWPGWMVGLVFGLLLSLADAIITKTYVPIILLGAVGGTIIGFIVGKWVSDKQRVSLRFLCLLILSFPFVNFLFWDAEHIRNVFLEAPI